MANKIDKKTTLAEHFGKGGKIYFGKAKDYPGTTGIIKKNNEEIKKDTQENSKIEKK